MLFLIKIGFVFKNPLNYVFSQQKNGLTYNSVTISDLVNKDTDGDGIPDWEERLYGIDPTKKETTPGIPDAVAIAKLQAEQTTTSGQKNTANQGGLENLTKTDQFSRELFSTVAAASQNGQPMDQATIDQISKSLADNIQNSPQRKIYKLSDLKINNNATYVDMQKYDSAFSKILSQKQTVSYTATDVLQEFLGDGENVNVAALSKLDPIIQQTNKILTDILKVSVPQELVVLHLIFVNAIEKLLENLNDMKLYDKDPVVALSAISQYGVNSTNLQYAAINLTEAFKKTEQKLKP